MPPNNKHSSKRRRQGGRHRSTHRKPPVKWKSKDFCILGLSITGLGLLLALVGAVMYYMGVPEHIHEGRTGSHLVLEQLPGD